MKYVTFKQLKIKNFLSVGEDEVCVEFNKGLHIVTGINRDKEDRRNGVGKSTIADALYFAIFGSTLREIRKQFIPNNLTEGKSIVELSFTINDPHFGTNDFHIIRTLGPSKCNIFKNGVDKTRDTIINTNYYIETILSSSPEVFQNCVIMTLNNHIPFMAKNKIDKRKFIEKIFSLEIFSKMLTELRSDQTLIKQDFDTNITRLEETNNYLAVQKSQRDSYNVDKKKKTETLQTNLAKHKEDLKDATDRLQVIEKLDDKPFKDKLDEFTALIDSKKSDRDSINNSIIELKLNVKNAAEKYKRIGTGEENCPVCLRSIEEHDLELIEKEKENLKNIINNDKLNLDNLTDKLTAIDSEVTKINQAVKVVSDKIANIEKQKYGIDHIRGSVEYIKRCVLEMEEELKSTNNDTNTFSDVVVELENKSSAITAELNNIKKRIDMLDVVKFVVSEEGVKSYIVKKILRNFNSKLTYYLKKLDSNSICVFNEYFEEEILNEKGKICLYNNFSGAERKAIDLACLFSFMDMRKAQGDVHYNLSFYDELFDSSLDEKGVDLVLEILNERVEKLNECVFVISHRKESIKAATGDIIFLEKMNGITRRVNFVD